MTTKSFGDRGEDLAAQYLEKRGCRILERQFRAKTGEIDIIAEDRGALLFIEVKTRRPTRFGAPAQAVGYFAVLMSLRSSLWVDPIR